MKSISISYTIKYELSFASMKKVTEQEYREFFKNNEDLKPIASFSDPDGTCHFGYGVPAMDTDWGISGTDKPLARCQMRKDNRHSDIWKCEYFLNVSELIL